MKSDRWLLPEGVQEVLPPESWRLEYARRRLLDLYWRWGFELIRPPFIEYLDSLLTGAGRNLDLQTFKLTDQLSGRMLGIRSDMTTQAARIDAHRRPLAGPVRYCYIGSVLRTRPEEPGGSRSPLQVGVELFGHNGIDADLEVLSLMLESLRAMGIGNAFLDLGHVAVYRGLVAQAGVDDETESLLFDVMQRKSRPDLRVLIEQGRLSERAGDWFEALIDLNGSAEVLDEAQALAAAVPDIQAPLAELRETSERLARQYPDVPLYIDLAELRGYRYKTGMVFAAFAPGHGRELARGGRYDNVGAAFGRSRPATGFSADLNLLAALGEPPPASGEGAVYAPAADDPALAEAVRRLRDEGRRVVQGLAEDGGPGAAGCDEELVHQAGEWQCRPVASTRGNE